MVQGSTDRAGKVTGRVTGQDETLRRLWTLLHGEEGEGDQGSPPPGDDQGSVSTGGVGDEGSGDKAAGGSDSTAGDSTDSTTFTREYVEKLRAEAAAYRTERNTFKEELDRRLKAEMSDLERAQAERDEAVKRAEEAETRAKRSLLESRLREAAREARFHNPQDAIDLIDSSSIQWTEGGDPDGRSIKAAVERVVKDRPYLVGVGSAGSAEGGTRGGTTPESDKAKQYQEEFAGRGYIPIPGR